MKKLPNINTILAVIGALGVFAPDVAAFAAALASLDVAWLATPIRILGFVATFLAAAPIAVPKIRAFLARFGLATPPGTLAPWVPGRPGDPTLGAQPVDLHVVAPAAPQVKTTPTPVTKPNPTGGQFGGGR